MHTSCAWLPVDQLAQSILEIAESCLKRAETTCGDDGSLANGPTDSIDEDGSVYNIVKPHPFPWATLTLLDQLQQHGFEIQRRAFCHVAAVADRREEKTNPAVKLFHYYRKTHGPGAARLVKTFRMENTNTTVKASDIAPPTFWQVVC